MASKNTKAQSAQTQSALDFTDFVGKLTEEQLKELAAALKERKAQLKAEAVYVPSKAYEPYISALDKVLTHVDDDNSFATKYRSAVRRTKAVLQTLDENGFAVSKFAKTPEAKKLKGFASGTKDEVLKSARGAMTSFRKLVKEQLAPELFPTQE